jgi:hypothetical protein
MKEGLSESLTSQTLVKMCLSKVRHINKGKQMGILPEGQSLGQGIRKIDWDMGSH